jgi:hypothetical protein
MVELASALPFVFGESPLPSSFDHAPDGAIGALGAGIPGGATARSARAATARLDELIALDVGLGILALGAEDVDAGRNTSAAPTPPTAMTTTAAVATSPTGLGAKHPHREATIGALATGTTDPARTPGSAGPAHTTTNAVIDQLG